MSYTVTLRGPKGESSFLDVTFNYDRFFDFLDKKKRLKWLHGKSAASTIPRLKYAISFLGTEEFKGPYHTLSPLRPDEPSKVIRDLVNEADGVDLDAPGNEDLLRRCLEHKVVYNTGGYWKSTPGNAGAVLNVLLTWAKEKPDFIWEVV